MTTELLTWLQAWYEAQCDGEWEHEHELTIGNIDNPGWRVLIDVSGTSLDIVPFPAVSVDRSERNWLRCRVVEARFEAYGGPGNLIEILTMFREWAERGSAAPPHA